MLLNIPVRSKPLMTSGRCINDVSAPPQILDTDINKPELKPRGPLRPDQLTPTRDRLCGRTLAKSLQALDWVGILGITCIVPVLGGHAFTPNSLATIGPPMLAAAAALTYSLQAVGAYNLPRQERFSLHMLRVTGAVSLGCLVGRISAGTPGESLGLVSIWSVFVLVCMILTHCWAFWFVTKARKEGRLTANIVLVGATENARILIQQALKVNHLHVLGIFDDRVERVGTKLDGVPLLGRLPDLTEHRLLPYIDRVVIAVPSGAETRIKEIVTIIKGIPNAITLFVPLPDEGSAASLRQLATSPLAEQGVFDPQGSRQTTKRVFDLIMSTVGIVALLPLFLLIGTAVRMNSPGPILFRQLRHGFNNEPITVLKFRSMRTECSDAKSQRQVQAHDERVTAVGRFIRKSSLDELPQLLNVFWGQMSLVGPRPHAIGMKTGHTESSRLVAEYAWRHRVKPGITGWAQINGSRGPVDTETAVRERVTLDLEYIERQSFWFDLYILLLTVPRLIGDNLTVR